MEITSVHVVFIVLCVSLSVPACFYSKPNKQCLQLQTSEYSSSPPLFVFGSSVFDNGNNNYIDTTTSNQANFWPYGETFFKYSTGRFSNGRLISDLIAEYAKLPLILPYLYPGYQTYISGANFASAGSGALVETNKGLVIDLKTQLSHFIKVKETLKQRIGDDDAAARLVSKAVYLFNIGTNDYFASFTQNSTYTSQEYVNMVIGNITDVIQEIHKNGGRKFAFLGLWNLGCLPPVRLQAGGSCLEPLSFLAKLHNTQLSLLLQNLEKQLQGFKYTYTNSYDFITEMTEDPQKYGFKEGKVACCRSSSYSGNINTCGGKRGIEDFELCENPEEYVFFDNIHLSERANQFFAHQMWCGDANVTWPHNLRTLIEE